MIDLSAGFVAKTHAPTHPLGKVTAFDEKTGLPIVRRTEEQAAPKTEEKPKPEAAEAVPAPSKREEKPAEKTADIKPAEPDSAEPSLDVFDHIANEPADQPKDAPVPFAKGHDVELPDGSKGKIVYLSPQLNIARIRTEDGRKLTIGHKQLRQLKGKPKA